MAHAKRPSGVAVRNGRSTAGRPSASQEHRTAESRAREALLVEPALDRSFAGELGEAYAHYRRSGCRLPGHRWYRLVRAPLSIDQVRSQGRTAQTERAGVG